MPGFISPSSLSVFLKRVHFSPRGKKTWPLPLTPPPEQHVPPANPSKAFLVLEYLSLSDPVLFAFLEALSAPQILLSISILLWSSFFLPSFPNDQWRDPVRPDKIFRIKKNLILMFKLVIGFFPCFRFPEHPSACPSLSTDGAL